MYIEQLYVFKVTDHELGTQRGDENRCCFVEKFIVEGKPIRMERALCQLRTESNSVVTSVAIHCSFFSASFKLHVLCHKKKMFCFGSHNETGFNSNWR